MNNGDTDYDRIAEKLSEEIVLLMHSVYPNIGSDNGIAVNRDEFFLAVSRLARLRGLVDGLAKSHRASRQR